MLNQHRSYEKGGDNCSGRSESCRGNRVVFAAVAVTVVILVDEEVVVVFDR